MALAASLVACCVASVMACGASSSSGVVGQDSAPAEDGSPVDSTSPAESSRACVPGVSIACAGPGACQGYQVCNASGTAFDPCDCTGYDATMPSDASPDAVPMDASGADGMGDTTSADAGVDGSAGPSDASLPPGDAAMETGPLPTGCISPSAPDRVGCGASACNSQLQACCGEVGGFCIATYGTGCNVGEWSCDGPEDCAANQMCVADPGAPGAQTVCENTSGCFGPGSTVVLCHADADCPSCTPYCVPLGASPYASCSAYPPAADGGVVYGPCDAGVGPPVSTTMSCGSSTCQLPGQVCCTGASPVCQPSSMPCPNDTVAEQCTSWRNCSGGEICCAMGRTALGDVASCTGVGECNDFSVIDWGNGSNSYGILCLTSADCPTNQPTCAPFVQTNIPMAPDAGWTMLICQ